ncbi:MAG TPA: 50S ribosomal protein L29 [Planctomycetota bacterium]|nr:50S ribosomal protein L29 [Planctomycetota bacterium]
MPVITAKSLREKTSQELQDQMAMEKKRLFDGVVKGASGEAIKPHEKRQGRRLIARIQAILRERELRAKWDKQISELSPKVKDAAPRFARVLKDVDARIAEAKKELEKPQGQRRDKPLHARVRIKHVNAKVSSPADRAAVNLAEAKRRRAALERLDVGQAK